MAEKPEPQRASQPFTFRGVARFAHGSRVRLTCIALAFALVSASSLTFLASRAWFPVIAQAVASLPDRASIQAGQLSWPGLDPQVLGTNSFLSIAVQPAAEPPPADRDLNLRLGQSGWEIHSLAGYRFFNYPHSRIVALDRTRLAPLWGAWQPVFLIALALAAAALLLASWSLLGMVYAILPFLLSAPLKRDITYGEAWKLSLAAQWPGAVLLSFAIVLYALNQVTLVFLLLVFAAHFLLSWIYLAAAPFCLPLAATAKNPFNPKSGAPKKRKNPFARV